MRRLGGAARLLALAVGLSACGKGCVRPETTETHDGKVKLTVRVSTKVYNAGIHTQYELQIAANPSYSLWVDCEKPALGENAEGTLIAWRCPKASASAWSLSRIVGSHHYEEGDVPELGAGTTPDFGNVKGLFDSVMHIATPALAVGRSADGIGILGWLAEDLRAERGAQGVGIAFASIAALSSFSQATDPWIVTILTLPSAEREAVQSALCGVLSADATPRDAYVHAAQICPFEPKHGEVALAKLAKADPTGLPEALVPWVTLVAISQPAPTAGSVGCAGLEKEARWLAASHAMLVAMTHTKCATAKRLACEDIATCEKKVCTEEGARARLSDFTQHTSLAAGKARPARLVLPKSEALTLAALIQAPLPTDLVGRRERFEYTHTDSGPTLCTEPTLPAGASCLCGLPPTLTEMCAFSLAARSIDVGSCSLSLDDDTRTIGPAKRRCSSRPGDACSSFDCCAPLVCRYQQDTGKSHCVQPNSRDE